MLFYAFVKTHQYAFKILLNCQYHVNKKKDQLHAYKPQRCVKVCLYVFIFTKKVFPSTFRVYKKKSLIADNNVTRVRHGMTVHNVKHASSSKRQFLHQQIHALVYFETVQIVRVAQQSHQQSAERHVCGAKKI